MDSAKILAIFKEITSIPRESGHEGPMIEYLRSFASARGLACKVNKTGNVLITREASKGKEDVPTLALQAHQDMVCEKNPGFEFDFRSQSIPFEIEDGWMVARNTTLGADDGIGVAACLALLESDLPLGKIECLFTISEETTMEGASKLEEGFLSANTLINLDSEDEGQMFVGCAGGMESVASFAFEKEPVAKGSRAVRVHVGGGIGGHSGDDINKERANALKLLFRFLYTEMQYPWQLLGFDGGNKHNAICRDAWADIALANEEDYNNMIADVQAFDEIVRAEFKTSDPGIFVEAADIPLPAKAIAEGDAANIIATLLAVPHGVQAMSMDIPGLVQTSTNMAAAHIEGDKVTVLCSHRSSVESELHAIAEKAEAVFFLGAFDVTHSNPYPGWKPNLDSHILKVCVESYKKLFGHEPEVKAIHAGLECGMFLEKFPHLDMISFGPTLRGVHAPGEKLELASLDKFAAHLTDVVLNFR